MYRSFRTATLSANFRTQQRPKKHQPFPWPVGFQDVENLSGGATFSSNCCKGGWLCNIVISWEISRVMGLRIRVEISSTTPFFCPQNDRNYSGRKDPGKIILFRNQISLKCFFFYSTIIIPRWPCLLKKKKGIYETRYRRRNENQVIG